MKRVLFRLSMPNRGSWNGGWSGADRNYVIVRTIGEKAARELLPEDKRSWFHSWSDGWTARIDARVMRAGERHPKSDGFCGYDWMVDNILVYGETEKPASAVAS